MRWQCGQADCEGFSVSGDKWECPGCGDHWDGTQMWWINPHPDDGLSPEEVLVMGGTEMRKRRQNKKRGGKKHKKQVPADAEQSPAEPNEEDDPDRPQASSSSGYGRYRMTKRKTVDTDDDSDLLGYWKRGRSASSSTKVLWDDL